MNEKSDMHILVYNVHIGFYSYLNDTEKSTMNSLIIFHISGHELAGQPV